MSPPAVSVVVPARNAAGTLPALFDALDALEPVAGGVEVVLVDDGSTDATAQIARERGATVVPGPAQGPATARNLGAARAAAPVLAFTDADCAPSPAWLRAALTAIEDGAALVQGAVRPVEGVPVGPFDKTLWVVAEVGLYESANIVIRRELFDGLGGFESWLRPRNGLELGEDVWLGWSARRAGADVRFVPEALVHHAVFTRSARDWVAERARLRFFPHLTRRVPELRDTLLFRRVFLSRRSAAFDAAVVGAAVALRRPVAAAAAAPYARMVLRDARTRGRRAALAGVAADGLGLGALLLGTARTRSPVL